MKDNLVSRVEKNLETDEDVLSKDDYVDYVMGLGEAERKLYPINERNGDRYIDTNNFWTYFNRNDPDHYKFDEDKNLESLSNWPDFLQEGRKKVLDAFEKLKLEYPRLTKELINLTDGFNEKCYEEGWKLAAQEREVFENWRKEASEWKRENYNPYSYKALLILTQKYGVSLGEMSGVVDI